MRFVTSKNEFEPIDFVISAGVDKSRKLPDLVFAAEYENFLFLAFDKLFTKDFFRKTSAFLTETGEGSFWFSVIDPDPRKYFFKNFLHYGTIECRADDTAEEFVSVLNVDPGESPADALIHNSSAIVVGSPSADWIMFGDRAADLAVCSFRMKFKKDVFNSIYQPILFPNAMAAAEYASCDKINKLAYYDRFVSAYMRRPRV